MEILNQTTFQFAMLPGQVRYPGHTLTLIVKGTFDLEHGRHAVAAKEQLYPTGDAPYPDDKEGTGSLRYENDFAPFKARADLLLVGRCHTPGGAPMPACSVAFTVGACTKRLAVIGHRVWKGVLGGFTPPEPFTAIDLRYENAFGGGGFKANPVGKGLHRAQTSDGRETWPLPNIESPERLIRTQGDHPDPAGFAPLGRQWKERHAKVGSYRGDWLKKRWPAFPEDFDWSHFNAAPPDLQVEGYLRGDEEIICENLHPAIPRYRARLPGVRVCCFVNEKAQSACAGDGFRQVGMHLDTLWVDMDAEQLVLVWRGVTDVRSEEFEEIDHVFVVSEPVTDPVRSCEHHHRRFLDTLDALQGENVAEEPGEPLEDDAETGADDDAAAQEDRASEEMLAKIQAQVAALQAAQPQLPGTPPPPNDTAKQEEERILRELGEDETEETPSESPAWTRERVEECHGRGQSLAGQDLHGLDLSGIVLKGADLGGALLAGALLVGADLSEANLLEANLERADLTHAVLDACTLGAAKLAGCLMGGVSLKDADATGADLSGVDMGGGALHGAIFDKALLARANLDRVQAAAASFSEADLTAASLQNAVLDGADFSTTVLTDACFRGASLKEATVDGANGRRVNMERADLTELRASEGCLFSDGVFREATGRESIWEKAELDGADFSYARMEGADFGSASLREADLYAADMKFAKFAKARLQKARLVAMNLFQGSLEKADLTGADLSGSNMYGVEFRGAELSGITTKSTNLKMTKLKNG